MAANIYTQPGSEPVHFTLPNKAYSDCVADMNPCQMNIATDRLYPVLKDHLGTEHSLMVMDDLVGGEEIPFGISGGNRLEMDSDFSYSETNKRMNVQNIQTLAINSVSTLGIDADGTISIDSDSGDVNLIASTGSIGISCGSGDLTLDSSDSIILDFDGFFSADALIFKNNGTKVGGLNKDGSLTLDGVGYLKERASATTDVAGYGQIWIKNDTPNTMWFTDDAGTDYQIGVGSIDGSGTATYLPIFSDSDTLTDSPLSYTSGSCTLLFSDITPILDITSNSAGATGVRIDLYQNSSSPAAADIVGYFNFLGKDAADAKVDYAQIRGVIDDTTAGGESGSVEIRVASAGTVPQDAGGLKMVVDKDGIDVTGTISSTGNITENSVRVTTSGGTTGGTGSAGAGNQYVELVIAGTTYKILHDGTV